MTVASYEIRLCQNCGLRYPLTESHPTGERCPVCLGATQVVLKRNLMNFPLPNTGEGLGVRGQLSALLDNIRSVWNVGAIFRTADGLGITKLYLCGITPTPEQEAVSKTGLGAEKTVAWEYSRNALKTAKNLKGERFRLIALEQDSRAVGLGENPATTTYKPGDKNVLIVGNEVTGVDPELLDLCDRIVHIPMKGTKGSLNVEVAFGIAVYQLLSGR